MGRKRDISEEVLITVRQIVRAIDLHSKKLAKTYGLTGPQLIVLQEIADQDVLTTGDLARNISLSHATVTSIIDRLVARNLVSRIKGIEDKRKMYLRLTEAGQQKVDNKPSMLQDTFVQSFNNLKSWEQSLLLSSIQRIALMMKADGIVTDSLLISHPVSATEEELNEYYEKE
jgi:DNA-binding MarR family transcriptional regulator